MNPVGYSSNGYVIHFTMVIAWGTGVGPLGYNLLSGLSIQVTPPAKKDAS